MAIAKTIEIAVKLKLGALLDAATEKMAELANDGEGCFSAEEQGQIPCVSNYCQCQDEAKQVLMAALERML